VLKPGDEIAFTTPAVDLMQMVGKYMFSGPGSSSAPDSPEGAAPAPEAESPAPTETTP
jgi:phospholipid/cholesterol/gamma-HCH transport system substrate-binding protein